MNPLVLLFPIFILGCATLDEMSEEERVAYVDQKEDFRFDKEEALIEAKDRFYAREAVCKLAGGVMVIRSQWGLTSHTSTDKSTKLDYEYAECLRW